ncbi:hypothetical protein [Bacillus tuaregi]|uniref:hypothetical protein n=1 Tax=Bacillus tuaregi TaxID=1816695 RepID=UPI00164DD1DD|nr:hypothetical protein [Bacillus tuaregi]
MKRIKVIFLVLLIIISFGLQILGLMELLPIYFTSPLLFVSFFIFLHYLNNRKRFKGL